jgi:hypothetical protein
MSSGVNSTVASAGTLLRWQFRLAHQLLDATIDRLHVRTAQPQFRGTFAQPAACYAQIVWCEDLSINAMLTAGIPLALSTWAGRTGLSELPLLTGETDWRGWARRVQFDLSEFRDYARAVYNATDLYLAALPDEAIDTSHGETPACLLSALLMTLSMRRGEIACLLDLHQQDTGA